MAVGSRTHKERAKKARELREKGVTFRDIAQVLKTDTKQVWRWVNYPLDKVK